MATDTNQKAAALQGHLRLMDLVHLSVRSFRNRSMRTFLTIAGMGVGIGAVLFLVSLGYGLQYILIGKLAATSDSLLSMEAFFPSESAMVIDETLLKEITENPNVAEISKIAELPGQIAFEDLIANLSVRVIEDNYYRLTGSEPDIGQPPKPNEKKIVVSSALLKLLGMETDESVLNRNVKFNVFLPGKKGLELTPFKDPFQIAAVVKDDTQPYLILNSTFLPQKLTTFQMLIIKGKGTEAVTTLRDLLVDKGLIISAKIDLINQVNKVLNTVTIILGIFGITALIVSAIGMFNTMTIAFLERTFEIGIMKAIGATDRDIRNLFLSESFLMGFLGGIGGVTIGIVGSMIFNFILNIIAGSFGGRNINLFIRPTWFIATIIISSSIIGFTTGLWPALRASKLSIKETLLK